MQLKSLFGLNIHDKTLEAAAEGLALDAVQGNDRQVYFVNAHCINLAAGGAQYYSALKAADTIFADGMGMKLAAMAAGDSLVDNVNGTDLFPLLCALAAQLGLKIGFLGARPGVAQRCAEQMIAAFPRLKIVYVRDGYFDRSGDAEVVRNISTSGAQILFVAMGVPNQELWLAEHAKQLNVPVKLGVGALFDFYSGSIPRAPLILRKAGLEWLFRLALEPKRMFGRYVLGNPRFIARLVFLALRGKEFVKNHELSAHREPDVKNHQLSAHREPEQ
jgi:exopolysaccharide biosynthesis WecB/TagA/CpsF family protein